jgi:GNAT superfamily N-acetyltransferase
VDKTVDPGTPVPRPSAHPDHDAVARDISGWFTNPAPEIGYQVSGHWFGYLSTSSARLILRIDDPDRVPAALAEARAATGMRTLKIWVDNRERAARLDAALRRTGCQPGDAITHLALVGRMTGRAGPEDLVIESLDETRLEEFAVVKLQSFADTESAPAAGRLAQEVASRRSELALTECQLGLLASERVAVLAYYRGRDQLAFNLGTRVPYRHRGIAQAMLARWADAGMASGCRSLIINAVDGGRPAELYRRMGFTDEIYWCQRYELAGSR